MSSLAMAVWSCSGCCGGDEEDGDEVEPRNAAENERTCTGGRLKTGWRTGRKEDSVMMGPGRAREAALGRRKGNLKVFPKYLFTLVVQTADIASELLGTLGKRVVPVDAMTAPRRGKSWDSS